MQECAFTHSNPLCTDHVNHGPLSTGLHVTHTHHVCGQPSNLGDEWSFVDDLQNEPAAQPTQSRHNESAWKKKRGDRPLSLPKQCVLVVGAGGGGDTLLAMLVARAHQQSHQEDRVVVLGAGGSLQSYTTYLRNTDESIKAQNPKRPGLGDETIGKYLKCVTSKSAKEIPNIIWLSEQNGIGNPGPNTVLDIGHVTKGLGTNKYNSLYEESMSRGLFPDLSTVGMIYTVGGTGPKYIGWDGNRISGDTLTAELMVSQFAFQKCIEAYGVTKVILVDVGGDITQEPVQLRNNNPNMPGHDSRVEEKPKPPGRDAYVMQVLQTLQASMKFELKAVVIGPGSDGHRQPLTWMGDPRNNLNIEELPVLQQTLMSVIELFKRDQQTGAHDGFNALMQDVFANKRATQIWYTANLIVQQLSDKPRHQDTLAQRMEYVRTGLLNRSEVLEKHELVRNNYVDQFMSAGALRAMSKVFEWTCPPAGLPGRK
jgi:hypothetical protein